MFARHTHQMPNFPYFIAQLLLIQEGTNTFTMTSARIGPHWNEWQQIKSDNKLYFRQFTPFRLFGFSQQTGTNDLTLISNTSWLKSDPSSCKKTVSALLGTRPDWRPAPNVGDLEKHGWRESTSGFPSIICVVCRPAPKNSAGSDVNIQTGL